MRLGSLPVIEDICQQVTSCQEKRWQHSAWSPWSLCKYRGFLPFPKQWLKCIWLAGTLINHGAVWWPSLRTTPISAPSSSSFPSPLFDVTHAFVMTTFFRTRIWSTFYFNYNLSLSEVLSTEFRATLQFTNIYFSFIEWMYACFFTPKLRQYWNLKIKSL